MYTGSTLRVLDNTGGNRALCIKIFSNSKLGLPGNVVLIAIKSVFINKKISYSRKVRVKKGTIKRCLLIRVSYYLKRIGNFSIKFESRGVALIGRWDLPMGTRVSGPIQYEVRNSRFYRVSMLSRGRSF